VNSTDSTNVSREEEVEMEGYGAGVEDGAYGNEEEKDGKGCVS
jgi:hypothetical protein